MHQRSMMPLPDFEFARKTWPFNATKEGIQAPPDARERSKPGTFASHQIPLSVIVFIAPRSSLTLEASDSFSSSPRASAMTKVPRPHLRRQTTKRMQFLSPISRPIYRFRRSAVPTWPTLSLRLCCGTPCAIFPPAHPILVGVRSSDRP